MTQDLLAHLAAVRDQPGEPDDADLGVLADHLEECGEHDRAELIRVQVELGRRAQNWPGGREDIRRRVKMGQISDAAAAILLAVADTTLDPLQAREHELTTRNPAWTSVPCPECVTSLPRPTDPDCRLCGGTGDLLHDRAALTRGYLTVTLPCALCWRSVTLWEKGEPETAPHSALAAILRSDVGVWVEAVRVSDRGPETWSNGTAFWNSGRNDAMSLPLPIWEMVNEDHPTAGAANDALARAVPRWARKHLKKHPKL